MFFNKEEGWYVLNSISRLVNKSIKFSSRLDEACTNNTLDGLYCGESKTNAQNLVCLQPLQSWKKANLESPGVSSLQSAIHS